MPIIFLIDPVYCVPVWQQRVIKAVDNYQAVLVALRRVIRATDLHSKYLVKKAGLTASQLLLLQAIHDRGVVTSGQLAKEISLSQATVTTILDRLEGRQLVWRERSEHDKRKVYVHLTELGRHALEQAPTPLQEQFIQQFSQLQQWEQTAIISSLQRVAHMMDAADIDASPVLDVGLLERPEHGEEVTKAKTQRKAKRKDNTA